MGRLIATYAEFILALLIVGLGAFVLHIDARKRERENQRMRTRFGPLWDWRHSARRRWP